MRLNTLALIAVLAPAVLAPVGVAGAATVGAPGAAHAWLATVDSRAYADSWATAGGLFRSQITAESWAAALKNVREPMGAVVSRKLAGETETTTLPGAPDGHYDVITFTTAFAAKASATETVVMAEEPTGWKTVGYFIK